MTSTYNPLAIEAKWQQFWEENRLFLGTQDQEIADAKEKLYLLFAFAYPSGSGLHVGHVESKTALDIVARYSRMQGKKVFFPVGWDAFGLPAENYAIKTGVHPAETTKNAINTFRRQIKRLAISYDWDNEIATCHPGYYKWTQWLFLQLYNAGLAYQGTGLVNWCPLDQTVLANEQVVNGACERCGTQVVQKNLKQWFFKITKYGDELISGLDQVDWPKPTKQQQLNWLGKSQGVTYKEKVKDLDIEIEAYDSVPQTYVAQSYCVIAPEHPLVEKLVEGTEYEQPVMKFVDEFKKRKVQNRFQIDKEIEGIFTGRYIENPFGAGDLPIWVSTFVIADYGSGIVNSSAHDERDFAFAKKYNIPLRPVMFPADPVEAEKVRNLEYPYHHEPNGILEQPAEFKSRKWGEVREDIIKHIEKKGYGKATTQFKLRDWLISRQRYWGAPIPIVYDPKGNPHQVKEEHLPWELPTDVDFKPTGESPLRSSKEFIARTERLYGKGWRPEFDTMDTFVDSSWYYLRYVAARNEQEFSSTEQLAKWLPVDFYMIGPEHIVLHLLYARFFTKFLRDQGYLKFDEPFMKMRHQGMILGPDGRKMSKSKGNVINPDDVVEKFGADTLRVYEMFMGPIEADKPWDTGAVGGAYRFLNRAFNLVAGWQAGVEAMQPAEISQLVRRRLHQTIRKVSQDIPDLKFNTAIAELMKLVNDWEAIARTNPTSVILDQEEVLAFVKLLAPFAPFMAEELYHLIKPEVTTSIHTEVWPQWSEELAAEDELHIGVQINGKVRGEVVIEASEQANQEAVLSAAKQLSGVQRWLEGKELLKEIYVPGKIVSLVVR